MGEYVRIRPRSSLSFGVPEARRYERLFLSLSLFVVNAETAV